MSSVSQRLQVLLDKIDALRAELKAVSQIDKSHGDAVANLGLECEREIKEAMGPSAAATFHNFVATNRINVYGSVGRGILRPDEALANELRGYHNQVKHLLEKESSVANPGQQEQ